MLWLPGVESWWLVDVPNGMADGSEDNAWLVDMIIQFVSSPSWNEPINSFVAEKCLIFDNLDSEMKHEYMECHQEFSGLVESLLAAHLLEVDISPDDFERQVMESGLKDDARMQRVVSQLMAAEDFLIFRDMMLNHHMQMQQEAEGTYAGAVTTAEEERLANDAAIAAAIAADASTMEEQAAAIAKAGPAAAAAPAAPVAPAAPPPAPASAAEERAFGAAGGSYGRAVSWMYKGGSSR